MRLLCIILTFGIIIPLNAAAQQKFRLTGSSVSLRFTDFVITAEKSLPVRFFFRDEEVKDLVVPPFPDSSTVSELLEKTLSGTSLHYFIESSGNILLTDNYEFRVSKSPFGGIDQLPRDNIPGLEQGQQVTVNVTREIGNPAEKNLPGKATLSGYITNKLTREPLTGVTVHVPSISAGAFSNAYGFYSITIPRGIYLLKFSSIGFKENQINLILNGSGEMNIEMNSVLTPLKEVVVSADKNVILRQYEVGVEKINITSFKLLPTSLGEPDIIKNLILLPGVQTTGEGSAGFNVRGGTADQNLILLYNAPVYNSSHFFGFFSAINSGIISDLTLYKGGIPAKYGGRISSVLDIATREGNMSEFKGSAGISPITTHLMVEGPVMKNKLSFMLAGRTTYSNWIFSLVDNPALRNSRASFYDLNGKVTWDIDKNNKIDISSYYSHDSFRFNSDTVYNYGNRIFALRWKHFYTSRFFSVVSVNNSTYDYDIYSASDKNSAFKLSHSLGSSALKADVNWFHGKHEFNFGTEITKYVISPGRYAPLNDSSHVITRTIEKENGLEGALYADDKFTFSDFLSISLGLRMSAFYAIGPKSVMLYSSSLPRSDLSITDTVSYPLGKVIRHYLGPEIRASLNFKVSDMSSLKLNYNRTRQNLHLLTNSISIAPTDIYKLSDYYVKPGTGDQIAVGFYKMIMKNRIEASAEIYYKWLNNMVDFKGGTNLIMDENIEKDIISLRGKAYGMEITLKKTEGKLRFSLSYTFSRVFAKSTGTFSDEIINSGKWFPANYEKPHDLVFTFNYLLTRRFSFSATYTYTSGRPVTTPVATYYLDYKMMVYYSERNKYRIPDYSRLDLSFRVSGNLKSHRIAHPNWTFSVYNTLGRRNVYSEYFRYIDGTIKGYRLSVFGRAIPTVTFSFDF